MGAPTDLAKDGFARSVRVPRISTASPPERKGRTTIHQDCNTNTDTTTHKDTETNQDTTTNTTKHTSEVTSNLTNPDPTRLFPLELSGGLTGGVHLGCQCLELRGPHHLGHDAAQLRESRTWSQVSSKPPRAWESRFSVITAITSLAVPPAANAPDSSSYRNSERAQGTQNGGRKAQGFLRSWRCRS